MISRLCRWLRSTELYIDRRGRYCVRRGFTMSRFAQDGIALIFFVLECRCRWRRDLFTGIR